LLDVLVLNQISKAKKNKNNAYKQKKACVGKIFLKELNSLLPFWESVFWAGNKNLISDYSKQLHPYSKSFKLNYKTIMLLLKGHFYIKSDK